MYLQKILKEDEKSTLYRFFQAQCHSPTNNGDWVIQIQKILDDLDIGLSFEEISKMSKHKYKYIVKQQIQHCLEKGSDIYYARLLIAK